MKKIKIDWMLVLLLAQVIGPFLYVMIFLILLNIYIQDIAKLVFGIY